MGELNHGARSKPKAKFKLVDVLTKHASHSKIPTSECPSADIVAINAMQVVQKMSKQASVKTFKGLADGFVRTWKKLVGLCRVVVIVFNTYYNISLKNSKRSGLLGNAVPVEFTVDHAFDISYTSLK